MPYLPARLAGLPHADPLAVLSEQHFVGIAGKPSQCFSPLEIAKKVDVENWELVTEEILVLFELPLQYLEGALHHGRRFVRAHLRLDACACALFSA